MPNGDFSPSPPPSFVLSSWFGRRVAGGAAAGVEHGLAVREIGCAVRERTRRHRRRNGDEPEHAEADDGSSNSEQDELAQHRRSLSAQSIAQTPQPEKPKGGATAALRCISAERSALLRPIGLVAAAAVLGHPGERGLEASRSFTELSAALESATNFAALALKSAMLAQIAGKRRGVAAGLGGLGEQVRQLLAGRRRRPRRCPAPWPGRTAPRPWPFRRRSWSARRRPSCAACAPRSDRTGRQRR